MVNFLKNSLRYRVSLFLSNFMIYLQEITDTENYPLHTYAFSDKKSLKCLGYIPLGGSDIKLFNKPVFFDKRGRKFKEVRYK